MSLNQASKEEWDEAYHSSKEYVDPYDAPPSDLVNHPPHYNRGEIECIKYIEDSLGPVGFSYYLDGNCKKYLHRWRYKDQIRDLEKLQFYIRELIRVAKTIQI
jgi:hypothetical protein